ncbi:MAG TPA: Hsp20/alpha crystallin family protein [Ktedonobacterales bacterium]
MALEPRETFGSLRDAVGRLFEESFVNPRAIESLVFGRSFPLDITETEQEYVIEASLPGVKPEDLQVMALGDTVTIRAARKPSETTEKTKSYVRRERYEGEVQRIVTLPTPIDVENVTAIFENGVLTMRIPKTEAAKPKQIPVTIEQPVLKETADVH